MIWMISTNLTMKESLHKTKQIGRVYFNLAQDERLESISLLEQGLWKAEIERLQNHLRDQKIEEDRLINKNNELSN